MNPKLFCVQVIKPTLYHLGLYTPAAENLLLGTAIQESRLKHRRQIGGPALSYFQIEPNTHDDIWNNYLKYRQALANKIINLMTSKNANRLNELEHNDKYACAIARVQYLRVPYLLPSHSDVAKMAAFWKKYYNTPLGRGKESEFIHNWNQYVTMAIQ